MRKYIFTIIIFTCVNSYGQIKYPLNPNIFIPYSIKEIEAKSINLEDIPTLVLPSYDNDSLFRAKNNGISQRDIKSNAMAVAFAIDTTINIKKMGLKKELKDGTLWLLSIHSKTANSLGAVIKTFELPEGSSLSIFGYDLNNNLSTYTSEYNKMKKPSAGIRRMSFRVVGNRLFIEYFEPNNVEVSPEVIIDNVEYYYVIEPQ